MLLRADYCLRASQAKPGTLSRLLEHWLPLVMFIVDVGIMVVEVAQMAKFAFITNTPPDLKPVKDTLDSTTSFGLPELSYMGLQISVYCLVAFFLALLVFSDRVELMATKRPHVRVQVRLRRVTFLLGSRACCAGQIVDHRLDCASENGSAACQSGLLGSDPAATSSP